MLDDLVRNRPMARTIQLLLLISALAGHPLFGQVELSGTWASRNHEDAQERGPGPYAVDYTGLPLNEEARTKALSYTASQLSLIERQCALYPPTYLMLGPFGMKIWNETDPVTGTTVAWKIGAWEDRAETTIWMDGRPRPSVNAPHEREGFTTGTWEGDTLVAYTTHMKAGYIRRNGTPTSDQATMTTHFLRHGEVLTVLAEIDDPIYFTEPLILSKTFQLETNPMRPIGPPCVPGYEGTDSATVQHYLPGQNPFVNEVTGLYNIPVEAVLGGAETMYPDYRKKLKDKYVRPEKCPRNCGGTTGAPPGVF
jgi:hypothetical protein